MEIVEVGGSHGGSGVISGRWSGVFVLEIVEVGGSREGRGFVSSVIRGRNWESCVDDGEWFSGSSRERAST